MSKIISTQQLFEMLENMKFTRIINQLHYHHTWKPNHSDYNGSNGIQLQESMKKYHIQTLGWSDIGQHLTLLPDGDWVTGRDFNTTPASIKGWNTGAICIEMLGNFNRGGDVFGGKQAESAYQFGAFFLKRFNRSPEDVKFHRDNPTAGNDTCPGETIDKGLFMDQVIKRYKGEEILMEIRTVEQALDVLEHAGIIQNKDYWMKVVDVVTYQRELIINMANYVNRHSK